MKFNGRQTVLLSAAVAAGMLLASAGVAVATGQLGGANNTISGCYKTGAGDLRVVGAGETCRPNELPITWSVQGPKGDQGPQGIQGQKGDRGPTGAEGPRGIRGLPGEKGATGAEGVAGPTGPAGSGGLSGYEIVSNDVILNFLQVRRNVVNCPDGKSVLGGGYFSWNDNTSGWSPLDFIPLAPLPGGGLNPYVSGPLGSRAWMAEAFNGGLDSYGLRVYAICAAV